MAIVSAALTVGGCGLVSAWATALGATSSIVWASCASAAFLGRSDLLRFFGLALAASDAVWVCAFGARQGGGLPWVGTALLLWAVSVRLRGR